MEREELKEWIDTLSEKEVKVLLALIELIKTKEEKK